MDYKKLLSGAGYKGEKAKYLARKLEKVPVGKLNQLRSYFPRQNSLAGVDLDELGAALAKEAAKPKPPKTKKPTAPKTAVKDGK